MVEKGGDEKRGKKWLALFEQINCGRREGGAKIREEKLECVRGTN